MSTLNPICYTALSSLWDSGCECMISVHLSTKVVPMILICRTRIDRMAFGQPECTCLNIQNVPLLLDHADSVNPKFGQSGVYRKPSLGRQRRTIHMTSYQTCEFH